MIINYKEYIKENKFERKMLSNKDDIKYYLEKYYKLRTEWYEINNDLTVDINCPNTDVRISYIDNVYNYFPINFGTFNSNLSIGDRKFITLEGSPRVVNGYFDCRNNKLTSLKGGPEIVHGWYCCNHNNIKTLKYSPKSAFHIACDSCELESLKYLTNDIQSLECRRNQSTLKDINDLPFHIFEDTIKKEYDSWLYYLDKNIIEEYLKIYFNNKVINYNDIQQRNDLKKLLKHYNIEEYRYIFDAEKFDLI